VDGAPVTTDVETAYSRAKAMTEAYELSSATGGDFWSVQATDALYPLLLAAGLGGNGIEWVRSTAKSGRKNSINDALSFLEEAHSRGIPGMKEAAGSQ
jgi:hypothetical protein